jgi:hypothetical protein
MFQKHVVNFLAENVNLFFFAETSTDIILSKSFGETIKTNPENFRFNI